jgi:hypothetical protein
MKSIVFGACVAVVLFLGFLSPTASAYPAGATVSTGFNPIRSVAGVLNLGTSTTVVDVIAAPADQDLILTEVSLGIAVTGNSVMFSGYGKLIGSDGLTYAVYSSASGRLYDGMPTPSLQYVGPTGVRIPAGVSLTLEWVSTYTSHSLVNYHWAYTLGGYLAQP